MNWTALMQRALELDDHENMRNLLNQMRRQNVGEAYYPGLKDLCARARQRLALASAPAPLNVA